MLIKFWVFYYEKFFGKSNYKIWVIKYLKFFFNLKNKGSLVDFLKDNEQKEEISAYLTESFGNETRIDYGTGHELAFLMFLMCLFKVGYLKQDDSKACVLLVFQK